MTMAKGTDGKAGADGGSHTASGPPRIDLDDRDGSIAVLFEMHHAALVRLAVVLGADDAEDIVSEAFYQLYRRWRRLRAPEAAVAYVRSSVVNLTRMRIRHLQVARRHVQRTGPGNEPVESGESVVVTRQDQELLITAVRALPARQREALVLRFWLDLSEREIAETMGVSAGSVKVHISRGKAALTQKLEGHR